MSQAARGGRQMPAEKMPLRFLGLEVTLDWLLRPVFGIGLAVMAIAAVWYGGFWFALFITVGAAAAVREWHRMLAGANFFWLTLVSVIAIIAANFGQVFFAHAANPEWRSIPWLILAGGALLNAVLSPVRRNAILWHAASMLYVGAPSLCLVAIREMAPHALPELFALFFAIWSTDTGALFTGSILKGPKLWPALSPNKTWAGFVGGTIFGTIAAAVVFAVTKGSPWNGALLGFCVAIVGHAGDLFESFVKRRVGRKNSGSLIPGHGGVLDRIDSMLFVAPVAALVFLVLQIDPFALGAA